MNNTQLDDAQYIDIVIPMYDLIEYRDVYSNAIRKFMTTQ